MHTWPLGEITKLKMKWQRWQDPNKMAHYDMIQVTTVTFKLHVYFKMLLFTRHNDVNNHWSREFKKSWMFHLWTVKGYQRFKSLFNSAYPIWLSTLRALLFREYSIMQFCIRIPEICNDAITASALWTFLLNCANCTKKWFVNFVGIYFKIYWNKISTGVAW